MTADEKLLQVLLDLLFEFRKLNTFLAKMVKEKP